jgi:hypothetical protein
MATLYWFQDLPSADALAFVCCYYAGFGILLTWLGRMVGKKLGLDSNSHSIGPAMGMIGTTASILIGLVIVALWNDYRVARATVNSEASELRSAARDVQLLAPASRPVLLGELHKYVAAVTIDEWPAMQRGSYSNSAGRALAQLTLDASMTRSPGFDLRARISRVGELRTMRLSQSNSGVVPVLWFALLTIPVLILAGLGLLNERSAPFHYLISTLVAVVISIAIFVTIEIDLPFRGAVALSPDPIASSIDQAVSESMQNPL